MRVSSCLGVMVGGLALSATAFAASPSINVGNHNLLPDTPGQSIQVFVSSGTPVSALNFNAQIGDGGSAAGKVDSGPKITGVDLENATIFAGHNSGQTLVDSYPQLALWNIMTEADGVTVPANGLLATLTLDTSGIFSGVYSLKLGDTLNGSTDFGPVAASVTDGSLTIVPEPASLGLLGMAGCLLLRRRR